MQAPEIIIELSKSLPSDLAKDLVNEFLEIKKDLQTQTFSRASAGKFIETVVQILEYIETGAHSQKPSVDDYLKNLESRHTSLNDDLKIVLSRIARSVYTLRNKRNILHKGQIDPNIYDLKYIYSSSQWVLTEIVRQYITNDIHKAGEIIEFIQLPVSSVIESIDGRKIVHANSSVKEEIILVLYSYYPTRISEQDINISLDRRAKISVYKALKTLWNEKLVHESSSAYTLTQTGFNYAQKILQQKA